MGPSEDARSGRSEFDEGGLDVFLSDPGVSMGPSAARREPRLRPACGGGPGVRSRLLVQGKFKAGSRQV